MDKDSKLSLFDVLGSICWFLMDGAWIWGIDALAYVMMVPAAVFTLLLFRYTKRSFVHVGVTAAMMCWLTMGILWMLGETREAPLLVYCAKGFSLLGVLLLLLVGISMLSDKKAVTEALRRFRRLRIFVKESKE